MLSAENKITALRPAPPFTAQQAAAILDLYVTQGQPFLGVAKQLRFSPSQVRTLLLAQGVMRPRGCGGGSQKLSPARFQQLKDEMPTTPNCVLARKYGLTRERIRQIRLELGYGSGRAILNDLIQRASDERQAQIQCARQQRRAAKAALIERLSQRWKSGMSARDIAAAENLPFDFVAGQIGHGRGKYPDKFPYAGAKGSWARPRRPYRPRGPQLHPHGPLSPAQRAAITQQYQAYWTRQLPAINRLSELWKAGCPTAVIAAELGLTPDAVLARVDRARQRNPDKFPFRHSRPTPAAQSTGPQDR